MFHDNYLLANVQKLHDHLEVPTSRRSPRVPRVTGTAAAGSWSSCWRWAASACSRKQLRSLPWRCRTCSSSWKILGVAGRPRKPWRNCGVNRGTVVFTWSTNEFLVANLWGFVVDAGCWCVADGIREGPERESKPKASTLQFAAICKCCLHSSQQAEVRLMVSMLA